MKVLIDHQVFQNQNYGGISRYFSELLIHNNLDVEYEIALKYTNNIHIINNTEKTFSPLTDPQSIFLKNLNLRGKSHLFNLYSRLFPQKAIDCYKENLTSAIDVLKRGDYDVFHPTYYSPYFLHYIKKPFVLTVHDLIYELFPEYYSPSDQTAQFKKKLIKNASHVIAVSNTTRDDLLNYYGLDESSVTVIHHGSPEHGPIESDDRKLPERYLLYVGERKGYKNFYFLLNSIADLLIRRNLSLFCAGPAFSPEENSMIAELKLSERIYQEYVGESGLFNLYSNALAFVFPSIYEGFGMPILEAFSCDCPVLLSDISCFHEVAADAALYFNPKSREEIIQKVDLVYSDNSMRTALIQRGKDRLKEFSWKETATKTAFVYRKALL
jgi:glycosyltransferase involved in cell wall biosynthesis